jgi:RNA polymerase sigma factor (sigma-70 family)
MKKSKKITGSASDEDLINKIVGGETILFEILMRRYNGVLYKIAKMYGFKSEDAEDLVQEAHIIAFSQLSKFEYRSSYKTWLSRVMINLCLHEIKHRRSKKEIFSSEISNEKEKPMYNVEPGTEKTIYNHELLKILEICVQRLPLIYRTVFVLREVEGYNVAETSSLLDISSSNVKIRLNRAKILLRKEIEKFYSPADLFDIKLDNCDKIVSNVNETLLIGQMA